LARLNLEGDEQSDLTVHGGPDQDLLRRASELPVLPGSWREYFRERTRKPGVNPRQTEPAGQLRLKK
jgi:YiiM-like, 3-alpha helix domain